MKDPEVTHSQYIYRKTSAFTFKIILHRLTARGRSLESGHTPSILYILQVQGTKKSLGPDFYAAVSEIPSHLASFRIFQICLPDTLVR